MITIIIGALIMGCFLPALVGWLGSRHEIGFGWAFLLSLLFTPLVGLLVVLLSNRLPAGAPAKTGCIGGCLSLVGLLVVGFVVMLLLALLLFPVA